MKLPQDLSQLKISIVLRHIKICVNGNNKSCHLFAIYYALDWGSASQLVRMRFTSRLDDFRSSYSYTSLALETETDKELLVLRNQGFHSSVLSISCETIGNQFISPGFLLISKVRIKNTWKIIISCLCKWLCKVQVPLGALEKLNSWKVFTNESIWLRHISSTLMN